MGVKYSEVVETVVVSVLKKSDVVETVVDSVFVVGLVVVVVVVGVVKSEVVDSGRTVVNVLSVEVSHDDSEKCKSWGV